MSLAFERISGIQTAEFASLQHACACDDECGRAQADFVCVRRLPDRCKSFTHDAHEPCIDFVFVPEEAGKILHPFEVADGHTASIGNHVWHDKYATFCEDVVGFGCGWTVGPPSMTSFAWTW